jgi:glycosyltransferase involved in cell wall biosynthesis
VQIKSKDLIMSNSDKNKPVHILHMAPLGAGGITSLVINLASQVDTSKVVFDYLTFYDRKELNEDNALQYGGEKIVVPIYRYKNKIIRGLYKFFGTIKILRKHKPDIIHINASFPYDIMVGISAKLAGVKSVFFHSHNSSMKKDTSIRGKIMPLCQKLIPIVSDCNLACSELAAQFMFPKKIIQNKNYTIVNNGIEVDKYVYNSSVRKEYRQKLNLEDKFVVGHIGRFNPQKNHSFLISIFDEIQSKRSDAVLLLIGIGELQEEIKALVEEKGLRDKVIFYGATYEVPKMIQAMDCFLLPSLYEGLPVACVEAQSAGLPVIMSDTITKEVALTDLAEYLPLSLSAEEWADNILKFADSHSQRKDMSQEIRQKGFDIKDVAEKLTAMYLGAV